MSQAFDDVYGNQRGPSFSRGGAQRGATSDPFSPSYNPSAGVAPPGGRELPAGFSAQPTAPRPDVPRPAGKPSDGARQAANEQAAAKMAQQVEAARQEAMAAMKAAGEVKDPMTASHAASQAAAQVAAHMAAAGKPQSAPRDTSQQVPSGAPQSVPQNNPQNGPSSMPNRTAPAAQVIGGIPLNQVYASMMGSVVCDPNDPSCDPRGTYNPSTGHPTVTGNMSARIPTGTVGVGQFTGQVPAGTPFGMVGGIYRGVTPPGIYGAGQAQNFPRQTSAAGTSPEEAWLNVMHTNADGWLDLTPDQQVRCLTGAGCDPFMMNSVLPAINYWCTRKTGRVPYYGPVVANGIIKQVPAGQAMQPSQAGSYVLPTVLLLGAAALGTYMYVNADKKSKSKTAKQPAKRSVRKHRSSSRSTDLLLPAPRAMFEK